MKAKDVYQKNLSRTWTVWADLEKDGIKCNGMDLKTFTDENEAREYLKSIGDTFNGCNVTDKGVYKGIQA